MDFSKRSLEIDQEIKSKIIEIADVERKLKMTVPGKDTELLQDDLCLKEKQMKYLMESYREVLKAAATQPPPPPPQQKTTSARKQMEYKGMSVAATLRKYFDALAAELSKYYVFEQQYTSYPTIGDVISARDKHISMLKEGEGKKKAWYFIYRPLTVEEKCELGEDGYSVVKSHKTPRLNIELPDLFTDVEWKKLKEMSWKTNQRIHNAVLPRTSTGKQFIILSHGDFNDETIAVFKSIGVKGKLLVDEEDLVVKDELEVSDSSSSKSPNKDNTL